ncbi:ATP-dependent DNA helicase [Marmoricola endophyticus]|uniref:DNA 3'-5' helicase n=1 Tax=Marmoricola endophyticus TaxID=2040280 RepID=A0A917BIJ1_9ACTN|nr:ATP-dependent DNA helicase [Marmoricola endophyticus]GGF41619.1 ATP-dependent DNA helicase [Marmoricola endophyticus]
MTAAESRQTRTTIGSPAELREVMGTEFEVSPQQWAAVSAPLEPTVVIAGAGSGKTSLMAARVVYLVATRQVAADQVLGLTFTTKAAAELRSRVRGALERSGQVDRDADGERLEPAVATYHSFASTLLTEHGLRIGHEPDTRLMADASRYQLAGRVVARHTRAVEHLSDSPPHVIEALLALDGALSEHLVDLDRLRAYDAAERDRFTTALASERARADILKAIGVIDQRSELLGLVGSYRDLKSELGLMDFSDQIALAARLSAAHPQVGAEQREAYRVVLLDEYQDTSVAQAQLLAALFSGPDPARGRGHPVTAVGDPNQAIYGWRGASVSNILGFGRDFPRADGSTEVPVLPLTVNRRSDRHILEVANTIAGRLYDSQPSVSPLEPPPGAAEGEVHVLNHETYPEELAWVAEAVVAAHGRTGSWREIGVLLRDNQHAADVFDTLSQAEVPVEIVGLQGLLALPEVAEVLATLRLLQDLTANASLLTLLTGPRWAIGPRDLSLLARRARELAGDGARTGPPDSPPVDLAASLEEAVAGSDPTEVVALADALSDLGEDTAYSEVARARFAALDRELRQLRRHVGEPLLDLVRRVIDVCGIDVELASSGSESARARRENLDLFVKAVAEFRAVDGEVSLPSLLAWFEAEDDLGGLDVATPSESDSVKLLTVHRAKGLEWDEVFCLGVVRERFPVTRSRPLWVTQAQALPHALRGDARDLAGLGGHTKEHLDRLKADAKEHQAEEELRLAYVAFTRARHRMWVSSYHWRDSRSKPNGPSDYQQTIRTTIAGWGQEPDTWVEESAHETNPLHAGDSDVAWPVTGRTAEAERRTSAAERVERVRHETGEVEGSEDPEDSGLDLVERAVVEEWDAAIGVLLTEAEREAGRTVEVALPSGLSATALSRLREDPEELARDLARPMPRRPSPEARFGTRFHAWVEARFGQQDLFDPDDLPGRADTGIDGEDDLAALVAAFESGRFADRVPLAVEAPFSLVLAGQVVRGRIDAVYTEPDGAFLLVDWKTGRESGTDPWQLAVYRVAWAELHGVPPEQVRVAFHFVRTDRTVVPDPADLPDRAALEALLR